MPVEPLLERLVLALVAAQVLLLRHQDVVDPFHIFVHGFDLDAEVRLQFVESRIDLRESFVDLRESVVDLRESVVDLREPRVDLRESVVDLRESVVDLREPRVELRESVVDRSGQVADFVGDCRKRFRHRCLVAHSIPRCIRDAVGICR